VEREPGEGSRFFLGLPASLVEARPIIAQPLEGPLVLVIEDNPGTAALLVDTLRQEGHRTEVLPHAHRIAQEAARLQPFAITLDVPPDDAQTSDLLEALDDPAVRPIPVLLMTGDSALGHGDVQRLADRAEAVLKKDDTIGVELLRHLRRLRERQSPAARGTQVDR
jgi:CheY-like chemotaxis protein